MKHLGAPEDVLAKNSRLARAVIKTALPQTDAAQMQTCFKHRNWILLLGGQAVGRHHFNGDTCSMSNSECLSIQTKQAF